MFIEVHIETDAVVCDDIKEELEKTINDTFKEFDRFSYITKLELSPDIQEWSPDSRSVEGAFRQEKLLERCESQREKKLVREAFEKGALYGRK